MMQKNLPSDANVQKSTYIVGRPNSAPQHDFFTASERFIAYGGARGGGKSWAVREKSALMAFRYDKIRILILRRTFAELRENHILPMMQKLNHFAKWKETEKAFIFPNESRIKFGYCDSEKDVLQYQGQEYDIIFIDEGTQFTEFQFTTLTACLRGVNDLPKRIYITCNPGGVGHAWVKRLFISRQYRANERDTDYKFIAAKVYDNKDLITKDPEYVRMLENLPRDLRRAWLNGDWGIFVGQYFTEWHTELHVVREFTIPAHWRKYFAMDYGLDMLAGYWIAMDENGGAWVYREVFEGRENYAGTNGGGLLMSEAAQRVKQMTQEKIENYIAPPDLWNRRQDTGRSVAQAFADEGMALTMAKNNRIDGWLELKEWLKPIDAPTQSGTGILNGKTARLHVFENCVNLIESLPNLIYDEKNPSDCASEPHRYTHAADAMRYFVASRPFAADAAQPSGEPNRYDYDTEVESFLNYGV